MKKSICLFLLLTFAVQIINAQESENFRKKHFNIIGDLGLQGYDPVAYFKQGKALKGKKDLAIKNQGVLYYFSSEENKEEFKKNAARYEPEYGGWCAYAMGANGEKVEIDPATFKIINGKLYLFYNKYFNNTLKTWIKDEASLKTKADQNWGKILRHTQY